MGSSSGTLGRMGSGGVDIPKFLRQVMEELKPLPDRFGGTMRMVCACLMIWIVVLTFRNPMADLGVFMVFIFLQRNKMMTRFVAVLVVAALIISSLWILGIAYLSWNINWLRVLLWGVMFWINYYFMSRLPKVNVVFLLPISFGSIFCFSFDQDPNPNYLISQLGWIWCAVGLTIMGSFLVEYFFGARDALDLLREEVRRGLDLIENHCLKKARGQLSPLELGVNPGVAIDQVKMIQKFGGLTALQRENCTRIVTALGEIDRTAFDGDLSIPPSAPERADWLHVARHLDRLRKRLVHGEEWYRAQKADGVVPAAHSFGNARLADAMSELIDAEACLDPTGEGRGVALRKAPEEHAVAPKKDFTDAEFATRATAATMACYMFASMTDWSGIHTCMITCAVSAMNNVDSQIFKQRLRIIGASIGGLMGFLAMFLIPHMDNLTGVLLIMALGTGVSAWVCMGRVKYSYIGVQMGLAFVMLVAQDPHATTEFTVIRDRLVGILVGLFAMRYAFIWWTPKYIRGEEPTSAPRLSPI
jgi:multidrug resistance protein MdtO